MSDEACGGEAAGKPQQPVESCDAPDADMTGSGGEAGSVLEDGGSGQTEVRGTQSEAKGRCAGSPEEDCAASMSCSAETTDRPQKSPESNTTGVASAEASTSAQPPTNCGEGDQLGAPSAANTKNGATTGDVVVAKTAVRAPEGTWRRLAKALRPQFRRGQLLGAVLVGTLGFALTVQMQHSGGPENYESLRPEEVRRLLHDQQNEKERLDQQARTLTERLDTLRSANQKAAEAQKHVKRQMEVLQVVQGRVPVEGEGVQITITDPDQKLRPQDLVTVIQELRGAQAEVMAINGVRLVTRSYVTPGIGGVKVDGQQLVSPYVITAIGHSGTLETAVTMEGGAKMQLEAGDASHIRVQVERRTQVVIQAVRGPDGSVVKNVAPVSTPAPSAS